MATKKSKKSKTTVTDRGSTDSQRTAKSTKAERGVKENDTLANKQANRDAVVGERPTVTGRKRDKADVVEITESKKRLLAGTSVVQVKAVRVGYYGHKRRRIGEVFDMRVGSGELPSWVIDISDAEPGQDEGTRGLHSGGREDDRIKEERGVSKSRKTKIADPTIIEDSIPLGEGGNERKPAGGDEHVI